jgi:YesN/AraC family two-component response regulator
MALDCMAQTVPSLLILDLRMPAMDGFQVLERMHSDERTSRVPVLVLTGQPLSIEDIHRLERYSLITVQTKGILSDDEIAAALHRSLVGADILPPETSALVKRAIAYFQRNYANPLTRDELATQLGVSKNYFSQIFRKELGISPWDYLTRYRIRQAERLLRSTTESITAIAQGVGFEDPSYFGRVFRRETGLSPTAYRAS